MVNHQFYKESWYFSYWSLRGEGGGEDKSAEIRRINSII